MYAEGEKVSPLDLTPRGGKDFRAGSQRQLNCRKADAARRGMDQHAIRSRQPRHLFEGIARRQIRDGKACRFFVGETTWASVARALAAQSRDWRSSPKPSQRRDRLRRMSLHALPDTHHLAGAFGAERPRIPGIEVEHVEYVAEIQSGRLDLGFRPRRVLARAVPLGTTTSPSTVPCPVDSKR